MHQQFINSTGEGAKREVVYDKQSQKAFVCSLSPFVAKCMEGSLTKEAFVATLQTCCDEELALKEIGADTAVQLPTQRKRKNDQALPPGPRKVTNLQLRAHLVVLALSKLKEARRLAVSLIRRKCEWHMVHLTCMHVGVTGSCAAWSSLLPV